MIARHLLPLFSGHIQKSHPYAAGLGGITLLTLVFASFHSPLAVAADDPFQPPGFRAPAVPAPSSGAPADIPRPRMVINLPHQRIVWVGARALLIGDEFDGYRLIDANDERVVWLSPSGSEITVPIAPSVFSTATPAASPAVEAFTNARPIPPAPRHTQE